MIDESLNPWTTLSTKPIYENPWISVHEHQVLNPNGGEGIYGVVQFKNKAIGVVPIDKDNYTYLIGQYRYPLKEYSWEIPEGGGPLEVDPLESAKRELKEETGFSAAKWTFIQRFHTSNSVTNEEGLIYLAEELTEGETEFDDTEQLEIKKVHLSEAVDMVMNNQITDSMSVAGILKVARMKGV
ncbi:NUDIX hydrolase [Cytophagaceae bacterium ABcell3]|nr:NUDIX hydrolase [Cytophagaceae bacterium ABcell3]